MPKTEVGAEVSVAWRRRVKYEKSSVDLRLAQQELPSVSRDCVVRMGAVGQGHEREEGPIILDRWVRPSFNTEPALYLGSSAQIKCLKMLMLGDLLPCVMEAHHANDGREAAIIYHFSASG